MKAPGSELFEKDVLWYDVECRVVKHVGCSVPAPENDHSRAVQPSHNMWFNSSCSSDLGHAFIDDLIVTVRTYAFHSAVTFIVRLWSENST